MNQKIGKPRLPEISVLLSIGSGGRSDPILPPLNEVFFAGGRQIKSFLFFLLAAATVLCFSGCSKETIGGTAVGAGAAGAAYEYQNKQALDDLEDDYEGGQIDKEEYLRRKDEIEDKSAIY
ncbi:hypothetical protein [Geoalkalibacter subterraneus]|uniref:hypothetical protein n=1 Tax=Geoalkalibacter subterraneus TaxID=483547 RepID=UPI001185065C|nr:hypothetical protein [Geoalkalibacter subterraneus]